MPSSEGIDTGFHLVKVVHVSDWLKFLSLKRHTLKSTYKPSGMFSSFDTDQTQ